MGVFKTSNKILKGKPKSSGNLLESIQSRHLKVEQKKKKGYITENTRCLEAI